MTYRLHQTGDCWSPCVWCYEDDADEAARLNNETEEDE